MYLIDVHVLTSNSFYLVSTYVFTIHAATNTRYAYQNNVRDII